jgi:hypothetical protein
VREYRSRSRLRLVSGGLRCAMREIYRRRTSRTGSDTMDCVTIALLSVEIPAFAALAPGCLLAIARSVSSPIGSPDSVRKNRPLSKS